MNRRGGLTRPFLKGDYTVSVVKGVIAALAATSCLAATTPEGEFLAANRTSMSKMMAGMAAKPSGDVDVDFVNMMEPHHRGAVDMAVLELRYGHNERLRRIAQGIVVEQSQEIDAMRMALGRPLASATAAGPRK
jgi:uncharacterized protein (DUF305 family)